MRALSFAILVACGGGAPEARTTSAPSSSEPAPPAPASAAPAPPPPALEGPIETTPLKVAGFRPAEHVTPRGATAPRPVVIVLHGNFDRPEWECDAWAPIVAGRAFLLCPRGIPRRDVPAELDRWEYGSRASILAEAAAGRAALEEAYPGFVDPGPALFAGFSLGAIHLAALAMESPADYARVYLVEGGVERWDRARARRFAAGGGQKIAMACGRPGCRRQAENVARLLEAAGAQGKVAFAQVGHSYGGPLTAPMRELFDWLVAGDPRF